MEINKLNKTLNEAATNDDRCNWLDEDRHELITTVEYVINKYNQLSYSWDEKKQQSFCERLMEILESAEQNLSNVANRMK